MRVKTRRDAARFVRDAGLAYVFPDNRLNLPSLWGAVCGRPLRPMEEEDWGWTRAVALTWSLKDELGARRDAWFGRFLRGKGTLIAVDVAEALASLHRDGDPLSPRAREIYERLGNVGALSTLRLRQSLRLEGTRGNALFGRAMLELYRRLLVANVGTDDSESRWPAAVVDRCDHAFPSIARARLPRRAAIDRLAGRLNLEPALLAKVAGLRLAEVRP